MLDYVLFGLAFFSFLAALVSFVAGYGVPAAISWAVSVVSLTAYHFSRPSRWSSND